MLIISQTNLDAVEKAIELLKNAKVIAIPTDTVYGFAVDASNQEALENLYRLKKRDKNKPIAIFLRNVQQIKKLFIIEKITAKLIEKFLPGKLTIVAKLKDKIEINLAKNLNENDQNFLGFRVVDSYFIKELFVKFDGVLAVTSANLSGYEVLNSASKIQKNFPQLDLIIAGDDTESSPSTVVKVDNSQLTIIRQGAIIIPEII
jgi:L-threonylcarbamoyladenylate synthase